MNELIKITSILLKNSGTFFSSKRKTSEDLDEMRCLAEIGRSSIGLFHDILNPISSLVFYLDLVNSKAETDSHFKNNIEPLIRSSKKIIKFIKIVQKDLKNTDSEWVNVNPVISQIVKILYHRARINDVSVVFSRKKTSPVFVRKIKIYQIVINLLSNSIDSFETINDNRKKRVTITTDEIGNYIILRVTDNGCGISEERLKNIFIAMKTTKDSGTGIGLNNTKRIVENDLGGDIKILSKFDEGTICEVRIKMLSEPMPVSM